MRGIAIGTMSNGKPAMVIPMKPTGINRPDITMQTYEARAREDWPPYLQVGRYDVPKPATQEKVELAEISSLYRLIALENLHRGDEDKKWLDSEEWQTAVTQHYDSVHGLMDSGITRLLYSHDMTQFNEALAEIERRHGKEHAETLIRELTDSFKNRKARKASKRKRKAKNGAA